MEPIDELKRDLALLLGRMTYVLNSTSYSTKEERYYDIRTDAEQISELITDCKDIDWDGWC